jgi:predicted amidophosphoribosyltransferase
VCNRTATIRLRAGAEASWFTCSRCGGQVDESDHWCRHCGAHLSPEPRIEAGIVVEDVADGR